MNKILNKILEDRKGHYVHALEVETVEDLKSCIEALCEEFTNDGFTYQEIDEFINSLSICSLSEDDETSEEIYGLDTSEYIKELI